MTRLMAVPVWALGAIAERTLALPARSSESNAGPVRLGPARTPFVLIVLMVSACLSDQPRAEVAGQPSAEGTSYPDAWIEAGKAVAIGSQPEFDPPIDPATIKRATALSHVTAAYRSYDGIVPEHGLAAAAVIPLHRQLSTQRREAFEIRNEIDECRGCASYINYDLILDMPVPEHYRLALTVTVGGQTREWTISRGFHELNVARGHPNEGENLEALVRSSISLDLQALGTAACQTITKKICNGDLRP